MGPDFAAQGGALCALVLWLAWAQGPVADWVASSRALPEPSPPPVAVALTMGDANQDGKLQLREYLGLSLMSVMLSEGIPPHPGFRSELKPTEQLVPEPFRERAEALLRAKHRHALARQRDFEAEDQDRDGALDPQELGAIIRRAQAR